MKTGILVHGRHLKTVGWERLVWGEAPDRLGTLPMAVLTILNRGQENIGPIIFGSGGSEEGGVKESVRTKQVLMDALTHQNLLQDFSVLKKHPRLQSTRDIVALGRLISMVICDDQSPNTIAEVKNAAHVFTQHHVDEVVQITCASHAPRCLLYSSIAREEGLIPGDQSWSVVPDHMAFAGTRVKDVVIIEPPHRGDDPMLGQPLQAHQVFPAFYRIQGGIEKKIEVLGQIQALLAR